MCVDIDACKYGYLPRPELSDPLELELQAAVSRPVCMLGTELGISARAGHTLNR